MHVYMLFLLLMEILVISSARHWRVQEPINAVLFSVQNTTAPEACMAAFCYEL